MQTSIIRKNPRNWHPKLHPKGPSPAPPILRKRVSGKDLVFPEETEERVLGEREGIATSPQNGLDYEEFSIERLTRELIMAANCFVCGKTKVVGNQISHSHRVTKRVFKPNLQSVHALVEGQPRRIRVCTRCIRSGKVQKAI